MVEKNDENIRILTAQILDAMEMDAVLEIALEQVEKNLRKYDDEEFNEEWNFFNEE